MWDFGIRNREWTIKQRCFRFPMMSSSAISSTLHSALTLFVGRRKSIRPVKMSDEVLVWLSVWSEVQIVRIRSSWCHCQPITPSSLAPFKSRLILSFWYRLTQVVLEKRPLNGWCCCCCCCCCCCIVYSVRLCMCDCVWLCSGRRCAWRARRLSATWRWATRGWRASCRSRSVSTRCCDESRSASAERSGNVSDVAPNTNTHSSVYRTAGWLCVGLCK